jgi:hypothetical protein
LFFLRFQQYVHISPQITGGLAEQARFHRYLSQGAGYKGMVSAIKR